MFETQTTTEQETKTYQTRVEKKYNNNNKAL